MDKYSLNARFYPVIFFLLPLVIIGVTYSIEYDEYIQILSTLGITSALLYFLSNIGRDSGKHKESKLWAKWGGMPSVQLLSYNNGIIDKITKQRYHRELLKLAPIEDPTIDFESANLNDVVDIYKYWTKYLISQTRDTKKYALQFKENISYGFRRNLWGLKSASIILLLFSFVGNYIFQGIQHGYLNLEAFSLQFFISEGLLFLLLVMWIFIINSNWIKVPAFAFGERLLESISTIK